MTPATPASRRRRMPSRSRTPPATRMSASYDRTSDRDPLEVRRGAAVASGRSGATPGADQLRDERRRGSAAAAAARERGQPLRPRVEPDRQPVAGDREAAAQVVGPVGDGRREDDAGRAGGEREPDRVGRVDAAGELERDRDPGGDRADRLEVGRAPARAPSKSTRWMSGAPCATNRLGDPVRAVGGRADAGRGARASRRGASGRLRGRSRG